MPFKTIGTDYAGPAEYQLTPKKDCKAYILLFVCNISRRVYLELTSSLTTQGFLKSSKNLIARRRKLRIICSDNAKTFQPAASWLKKVNKDDWSHEFLFKENIRWKFNLSSASVMD